jgi:hypothetical protein
MVNQVAGRSALLARARPAGKQTDTDRGIAELWNGLVVAEDNDFFDPFVVNLVALDVLQAMLFLVDVAGITVIGIVRWLFPWRRDQSFELHWPRFVTHDLPFLYQ